MFTDLDSLFLLDKRGIFPKVDQTLVSWLVDGKKNYESHKDPILIKACNILDSLFGVFPDWCVFRMTYSLSILHIAYYDEIKEEIFISQFIANLFNYDVSLILAHEICHACRKDFEYDMFDEFLSHMVYKSHLRRFLGMCFSNILISFLWLFSCLFVLVCSIFFSPFILFIFLVFLFLFWSSLFIWVYFYRYKPFSVAHNVLINYFNNPSIARYVLFRITQNEALSIAWIGFSIDLLFDKTARWEIINMAIQKHWG